VLRLHCTPSEPGRFAQLLSEEGKEIKGEAAEFSAASPFISDKKKNGWGEHVL